MQFFSHLSHMWLMAIVLDSADIENDHDSIEQH